MSSYLPLTLSHSPSYTAISYSLIKAHNGNLLRQTAYTVLGSGVSGISEPQLLHSSSHPSSSVQHHFLLRTLLAPCSIVLRVFFHGGIHDVDWLLVLRLTPFISPHPGITSIWYLLLRLNHRQMRMKRNIEHYKRISQSTPGKREKQACTDGTS